MSTSVNAETDCAFQLRRPTASTYIDRIEAATEKRSMHSSAARICCTLAARYAANAVFQRNSQRAKSNKRLDRRMASTICRYRSEQRTDHIVGRSSKRLDSWLSRCEPSGVVSRRKKKLLLTNTYLPLDGVGELGRAKRVHHCGAAIVELASKESTCVVFSTYDGAKKHLLAGSFGKSDKEVVLRFWNAPSLASCKRGHGSPPDTHKT
jgi:hypothetical protein